jgi:F0F1-type ATP synthase beta subunit
MEPLSRQPERRPIHAHPAPFCEFTSASGILETGIKVNDLLSPLVRGGKTGLFDGAGVGKTSSRKSRRFLPVRGWMMWRRSGDNRL